jgi:hypothetical protein
MIVAVDNGRRWTRVHRYLGLLAIALAIVGASSEAHAQDIHIQQPVEDIERVLREDEFKIVHSVDNRFEGDRTQRVVLRLSDKSLMKVKWAESAKGGGEFNNEPRYEVAAYEFQKLFLDDAEYVVPPTVARAFDLEWYRRQYPDAEPTFEGTSSVLVAIQYWLANVVDFVGFDKKRFRSDPDYARSLANFNILTYLVMHADSNEDNYKMARDQNKPRIFSVDNGLSFGWEKSDRGEEWRYLRIDRVPLSTVERLRKIGRAELDEALSVVAQFEIRDGRLVAVEKSSALNPKSGIRLQGGVLQLGLSSGEISGVESRLKKLLKRVDKGKLEAF